MSNKFILSAIALCFWSFGLAANALQSPSYSGAPMLVDGNLTGEGSTPFHLTAVLKDGDDFLATVEEEWLAPNQWRRVIKSPDFSQTLVANGERVFDQHSKDYMPIALEQLVGALVDPNPLLSQYVPGDVQWTRANGIATEYGELCLNPERKRCLKVAPELQESVEVLGKLYRFSDYRRFNTMRIAGRIQRSAPGGDLQTAQITSLQELKNPDPNLLSFEAPTPDAGRFHRVVLDDDAMRALVVDGPALIWPQVLDGAQTGPATFYVGLDPEGHVREVLPVKTVNERTNDPAVRMISRWKFKPAFKDGVPVQAEGLLKFTVDTRAYGPPEPLTDMEVRKLAAHVIEPVVPPGTVPPGTEYKLWIAVDAEGNIIEEIAAGGPWQLFKPVDEALHKWGIRPVMENGQPRPYRAFMDFKF